MCGLPSTGSCPECGLPIRRSIEAMARRSLWTLHRVLFAYFSSALMLLAIALNVVFNSQWEPLETDVMPDEWAELFMRIWACAGAGWVLTLVVVIFLKRVPVLLWLVAALGFAVAIVGVAYNYIVRILILMSV